MDDLSDEQSGEVIAPVNEKKRAAATTTAQPKSVAKSEQSQKAS